MDCGGLLGIATLSWSFKFTSQVPMLLFNYDSVTDYGSDPSLLPSVQPQNSLT